MIATLRNTFQSMFSLPVLMIWFSVWIVATVAGPFGTYETLTFLPRIIYWGLISGLSVVLGYLSHGLAIWIVGADNPPRQAVAGTTFSGLLIAPMVWMVTELAVLYGGGINPGFGRLVYYTVLVSGAVSVLRFLMHQVLAGNSDGESAEEQPMLWQRLPDAQRHPVLRLSAANHVVQVVTETGCTELRMRFADAVNEMSGTEGFCTHRSHWVATAAVRTVRRDANRWVVVLANGDEVPVSRKYQPDLEEAGLI